MRTRWMLPMATLVFTMMTTCPVLAQSQPETSPPATDATKDTPATPPRAADADAPTPSLRLAEVTVCRKVSDERTPIDAGDSFPTDVGMLTCFTDVREAGAPAQIYHRWYVGDELVAEVPMQVKGPRWRCWSEKEILPGWSGQGRVEIVNDAGDVLGRTTFTLVEPEAVPSPPAADNS